MDQDDLFIPLFTPLFPHLCKSHDDTFLRITENMDFEKDFYISLLFWRVLGLGLVLIFDFLRGKKWFLKVWFLATSRSLSIL